MAWDTTYYDGTQFEHGKLVSKIQKWIDRATEYEKMIGCDWYWVANRFAKSTASRFGFTLEQTAAVISILSPATRWEITTMDAQIMFEAASRGESEPNVTTYSKQANKAWIILQLSKEEAEAKTPKQWERLIGTSAAKKTIAFFWNICDPTRKEDVTIDRWITRALDIRSSNPKARDVKLTSKQYEAIRQAFLEVARKYDCLAWQVQATVWISTKEDNSPKGRDVLPF